MIYSSIFPKCLYLQYAINDDNAMKHMKFLTFFFCIAFAVFACSSNNETDPNAGGLPYKEEPLATDFAKGACLLYTSPSPRDVEESRMPSSA